MSKETRKLIHMIYGIALSIVIVIVGIRFILGCYHIYTTGKAAGGQIYSRAAVAEAFGPMALATYLCLALVIGSFILHLALPVEKKKVIPEKNRQLILSRLQAKTDLAQVEPQLQGSIQRQAKNRLLHILISAGLLLVGSTVFMAYVCRPSIWPAISQVTSTMVESVFALLMCLALPAGYTIFTAYFCRKSLDKEIELMKEAAKLAPSQNKLAAAAPKKELGILIARYSMMAIAIVCIVYGFANDGVADVIGKAAKICTECVGLG